MIFQVQNHDLVYCNNVHLLVNRWNCAVPFFWYKYMFLLEFDLLQLCKVRQKWMSTFREMVMHKKKPAWCSKCCEEVDHEHVFVLSWTAVTEKMQGFKFLWDVVPNLMFQGDTDSSEPFFSYPTWRHTAAFSSSRQSASTVVGAMFLPDVDT
jgi:hypothetical protein